MHFVRLYTLSLIITALYLLVSSYVIQKLWVYSALYFWARGPQAVVHPTYDHVLGISVLIFLVVSVIGYSFNFMRQAD